MGPLMIFAKTALLADGWASDVLVTVTGGRIADVQTGAKPPQQAQRVDILLPAMVNLHSHAFQRAMAGLTERRGPALPGGAQDSFWTWRDLMYRFLNRLTPDDVQSIAAMVMLEMAEAGFAAVAEFHYLHHAPGGQSYDDLAEMSARIVAAADQTGLGLTLLPVLYQRGGCDGRALSTGQLRFGNDPERFGALWQAAQGALEGFACPIPCWAWPRIRCGRRDAEGFATGCGADRPCRRPSTSMSPNRWPKWTEVQGATWCAACCNGCWRMHRPEQPAGVAIHATQMEPCSRRKGWPEIGRDCGALPDHRGQSGRWHL